MLHAEVKIHRDSVSALCREFGVSRLAVYGSAIRDDFDVERSDVDMLVDFLPGQSQSLFTLIRLEDRLSMLFHRKVDLTTFGGLSKYIRDKVLTSAETLYDAA
jgi:predicted nucleotidyltransferase